MPNSIDTRDHLLKMFARYLAPRSMLDARREDVEAVPGRAPLSGWWPDLFPH